MTVCCHHTSLKRQRRKLPTFAGASGSSSQTTSLVTPAPEPLVCAAALLELAKWCQQRQALMEDRDRCPDTNLRPPAPTVHGDSRRPGDAALATADARSAATPGCRAAADAPATPPRPKAKRRQGGDQ